MDSNLTYNKSDFYFINVSNPKACYAVAMKIKNILVDELFPAIRSAIESHDVKTLDIVFGDAMFFTGTIHLCCYGKPNTRRNWGNKAATEIAAEMDAELNALNDLADTLV